MTDNVEIEEKKLSSLTVWNISDKDREIFYEIMRQHGRKGDVAFKALIDNYMTSQIIGELLLKLQGMDERVSVLENEAKEKRVKTFGGGK